MIFFFWFYWASLQGCSHKPIRITTWLKWLKDTGPKLVIFIGISVICFWIQLALIFFNFVRKYWIIPSIALLAVSYNLQSGVAFVDHGFFNRFLLVLGIGIIVFIFTFIKGTIYVMKKGRLYLITGNLLVIIT